MGQPLAEPALLLPVATCGVRKSWTADRCTAVLVKDTLIASVYAPGRGTL